MTFSLLGVDRETGMSGAVVSSSSPAVGARCVFVRAGVGAAASQNVTDPRLGPQLLDLLASGRPPSQAVDEVVRSAENVSWRQLSAVDLEGRAASYSGERTLGRHATVEAENAVAAGNLLSEGPVLDAMLAAFAEPGEHLGDRLVAALRAGVEAGGEEGPVHSASLLVADRVAWPVADLRVDWSDDPIRELTELWARWKPELETYVVRALDPDAAPSFGVPGDT